MGRVHRRRGAGEQRSGERVGQGVHGNGSPPVPVDPAATGLSIHFDPGLLHDLTPARDLVLEDGGNVGGQPAAAFDDGSIPLRANAQPQAGRGNVGGIHSHKELYHGTWETQGAPFKTQGLSYFECSAAL